MTTSSVAPVTLSGRAAVHAAPGYEYRLATVDALVLSDRSHSELAAVIGIESNLLAHHLDVLACAGVVERVRSSGDGRRRYLKLVCEALARCEAAPHAVVSSVLFVCTENSARPQLAAAIWNASTPGHVEVAGTHPAARVHPLAVTTTVQYGLGLSASRPLGLSAAHPRSLAEVVETPDVVVTLCERAHEELTGKEHVDALHWSVPDPAVGGTVSAFTRVFATLQQRIDSAALMFTWAA